MFKELQDKLAKVSEKMKSTEITAEVKAEFENVMKDVAAFKTTEKVLASIPDAPTGTGAEKINKEIILDLAICKVLSGNDIKEIAKDPYFKVIQKTVTTTSDVTTWIQSSVEQLVSMVDTFATTPDIFGKFFDPMPTSKLVIPALTVRSIGSGAEAGAPTLTSLSDKKFNLDVKSFKSAYYWTVETEIDAIVKMLPDLKTDLMAAIAYAYDDAIINGNTSTGTDHTKYWNGLRTVGLAGSTTSDLSTFSYANLNALRKKMAKWGVNPKDLRILVDSLAYFALTGLPEMKTIDVLGPAAVILTGQVGSIFGIPVIYTEAIPLTNATGAVDATPANNIYGSLIIVNRRIMAGGNYGGVQFITYPDKATDSIELHAIVQKAFALVDDTTITAKAIAIGYKIS